MVYKVSSVMISARKSLIFVIYLQNISHFFQKKRDKTSVVYSLGFFFFFLGGGGVQNIQIIIIINNNKNVTHKALTTEVSKLL